MLKRLYTTSASLLSRISKREGKAVKQTQILDEAIRLYAKNIVGLSPEEIEELSKLPPLVRAKKSAV